MDHATAQALLAHSECIYSEQQVNAAVRRVATEINARLGATDHLLVLCVMKGGLIFTGQLLPLLTCPLELDYLHVSRYGDKIDGGKLSWRSAPWLSLKGRTVLIVDDILDEGVTLTAICERVKQMGAHDVLTAVFVDKQKDRPKPIKADFVGLPVDDRFVFGFGMDIREAWRHLPTVHAYLGD